MGVRAKLLDQAELEMMDVRQAQASVEADRLAILAQIEDEADQVNQVVNQMYQEVLGSTIAAYFVEKLVVEPAMWGAVFGGEMGR